MAKILIVEDNEQQREQMKLILGRGNEVDTAATLEEGLQKLSDNPDVVLTDWNIKNSNSEYVYSKEIIEAADNAGIKTIVLTAILNFNNELNKLVAARPNIIKLDKPTLPEKVRRAVEG